MFPSDSLPSEIRFRQAYTLSLYLSVMGRVSPVPNHTFHTYRFLYTEGFLRAAFQFLHTFHGFRLYTQGSTSLCPLSRLFFTIRQNSLYVTVCMIARPFFKVTLPTRLVPCITATHRVSLHGSLAITVTGLTPASVVQLCWTHRIKKHSPMLCPFRNPSF